MEEWQANAYKVQLLQDMAISGTLNVGDLSPYVEDNFEDPLDLSADTLEEGEVGARHNTMGDSQDQCSTNAKGRECNQAFSTQILTLFPLQILNWVRFWTMSLVMFISLLWGSHIFLEPLRSLFLLGQVNLGLCQSYFARLVHNNKYSIIGSIIPDFEFWVV